MALHERAKNLYEWLKNHDEEYRISKIEEVFQDVLEKAAEAVQNECTGSEDVKPCNQCKVCSSAEIVRSIFKK